MATRRITSFLNAPYVQSLKTNLSSSLVINPNNTYNSILLSPSREKPTFNAEVTARFNVDSFDGIQLYGYISKNSSDVITGTDCVFSIYKIEVDDNWDQTFLLDKSGTIKPDGSFIATATQAELTSAAELDGELTFAIKITIKRFKKTYKKTIYVNHLGIYDNILRLRQDVEFLDITKLDE